MIRPDTRTIENQNPDYPLVREKDKVIEAEIFPDYEYAKKKHVKDIQGKLQELVDGFNQDMPVYKRITA